LRSHVFGQGIGKMGCISHQYFAHTGNLCGGLGRGNAIAAGDQHVHVTTAFNGGSDSVEGRTLEGRVVVFCNYERCHLKSPSLHF
jgi:hypothetical protein